MLDLGAGLLYLAKRPVVDREIINFPNQQLSKWPCVFFIISCFSISKMTIWATEAPVCLSGCNIWLPHNPSGFNLLLCYCNSTSLAHIVTGAVGQQPPTSLKWHPLILPGLTLTCVVVENLSLIITCCLLPALNLSSFGVKIDHYCLLHVGGMMAIPLHDRLEICSMLI